MMLGFLYGYALSVAFLVISGMLFMMDRERRRFDFMLRMRALIEERARWVFITVGTIIGTLMLVFPVYPGPILLGDIIPAGFALWSTIYFGIRFSKKHLGREEAALYSEKSISRRFSIGISFLVVAGLHFFLAPFVLL